VKGFAEIAAPLHALTRKGKQFVWDDLCQRAFEALKGALTSGLRVATRQGTGSQPNGINRVQRRLTAEQT
jgi:hypothetical protein